MQKDTVDASERGNEALRNGAQTSIKEISRRVNVWWLNMPLLAKRAIAVIGTNSYGESVTGFYTKFGWCCGYHSVWRQ